MNFAIIVAAGKSKRMKKGTNKVFLPLLNKPMIYYTIKNFQECNLIDEIIVVAQKNVPARKGDDRLARRGKRLVAGVHRTHRLAHPLKVGVFVLAKIGGTIEYPHGGKYSGVCLCKRVLAGAC